MPTILYVEDHPPAQMLMQAIVDEFTAHTLVIAENGAEAQQAIQDVPPDLYILDLDLPDTDGVTLARTLCTQHPAPVILVSAYAEAAFAQGDEAGLPDLTYLAKPLDPDHVAQTIQRALA